MSDNRALSMADTVHERVGRLEQVQHTHSHRITQLENLPERVSSLERDFAAMNVILSDIKMDTSQTRQEVREMKTYQDKTAGAIEALPKYIKLTMFVITIASLAGVVSLWTQ